MIVYLSEYIDPAARQRLAEKVQIVDNFDEIEKIDAILLRGIKVDAALMDRAKNLKLIAKHGVGVNNIDLEAAKERGIMVTNTPGANGDSVAELVVGLILASARRLHEADTATRGGKVTRVAPPELRGNEIGGKVLGQLGIGNIGSRVSRILKNGFGMQVIAYDPWAPDSLFEKVGVKRAEKLEDVLEAADIINISFGLTDATKNLIHGDMFKLMKKSAILINAARGGIVNEEDLCKALKNGVIRAAACDAFVEEPPSGKHPLFALPNFIGTPHLGADTEEALQKVGQMVVDEVLRVADGKAPLHRVV